MLRTASTIVNPSSAVPQLSGEFSYNPLLRGSNRRRALYLNSIVFGRAAVKPLMHCFSPKLRQATWMKVSSRPQ